MKRMAILGAVAGAGIVGIAVSAVSARQVPQQPLTIEQVRENLYVVFGGGGNTAAYVTSDGVVLVDTKLADHGQAILDQVRTVTDRPVTHIINTHTHGDHVGSNQFFPASVEIVAHENTAANMGRMEVFQQLANRHGLPDRSFGDRLTLLSGNDAIDLYHFGPAHTSGDAFVVFRSLRVMHAGDAFPGPSNPIMDTNNGGSGVSYAETLERAAEGIRDVDTVIPGHAPVTDWAAFLEYRDYIAWFTDAVEAAARAGRTQEQTAGGLTPDPRFADYDTGRAAANIEVIYGEVGQ
jgi:cyclase